MYYYAMGEDKSGNWLMTSYKNEEQAKKYRVGATVQSGVKYLDIAEDGSAKATNTETGLLLRTMIKRNDVETFEGNFVVYAKTADGWVKTQFRYKTYALANQVVKGALIQLYEACAVVEEDV